MTQNTSHAVMAQRSEPHDSLDFFPTPPWATRALCEFLATCDAELSSMTVWEPACGEGHMARPLAEYFGKVLASDVHQYSPATLLCDFLFPGEPCVERCDWIITNPPFRLGMQFALTAIDRANRGVALLVRTAFLEGADRHSSLFSKHPPVAILQFCERVPMVKGRYDPTASTATSYCWIIWLKRRSPNVPTLFGWIAPCRSKLERPGDAR